MLCNSTRTNSRFVNEIDGFTADTKVVNTVLVPLVNEIGTPIGVCQALNKIVRTTSTTQSFYGESDFTQADLKAATALASEVRHAKTHIEYCEHLRDSRCPLDGVSSVLNLPDMHAKACFVLRDGLGVTLARVILVDQDMKQLRVIGERNADAFFPLAANSLLGKVVNRTGQWELLRTPSAGENFSCSSLD